MYPARVLESYPHDADAFTQGLHLEEDGTLIESTGLYGESTVRRVDVESGRLLHCERLPGAWFGEGVTVQAGRCIQLLWREGLLLVRDARTLKLRDTVALPSGISEGWGITGDGAGSLFVSDGSDILHELDAHSFRVNRRIAVHAAGRPLPNLNELQWVRGEVWANLWHEDRLAVIEPRSGAVRCFVDLRGLLTAEERRSLGRTPALQQEAVLNGLAYDEPTGRLLVTGKLWPRLFAIATEALQKVEQKP